MKRICVLLLALALLLPLTGCVSTSLPGEKTVTDLLGRTVSVPAPEEIQRVVCIGAGALRLYCYVGDMNLLSGVEACERGFLIAARPYQMLNESRFLSLPNVGAGGPQGSPDAEAILAAGADIIFSLYTADAAAMDTLEAKTGIPVVVLSYGETEAFDEELLASLSLMGEILGREKRAAEVVGTITGIRDDLDARTRDIPESDRPTAYIGCHSNYGTHGIGSSRANYSLFNAVHARNVLDIAGYTGYQRSLDFETLLTLNPEVIILDAGGLANLREEYAENRAVFEKLQAFQSGEVYLTLPYNAYYTNLEIAYANAYFIGKSLYPDAFADVNPGEKFTEICRALLGEDCYPSLASAYPGAYEKLDMEVLK